ncbi:MAG TPA: aldo/keto reductase [Blastocatellia bacterium]|nr:aldo/keto reductase [Blastocatellia bacterium]HMV84496.1 aldo/keto reductase [Blastocatellia bacterium]HMY73378.1 aldo/keto reductase [Blastocatellia bacterium]HMZ18135.1 aldo/keto reductase [Blastocatellia bacterium]HNG30202.1 aldo/keto reductase [Blastocatellia bacterium]
MEQRKLGTQGLIVSMQGLGCMSMSHAYGTPDDEESIATLFESLDLGINFFDTAEIYGPYKNEELIGRAFKEVFQTRREQVFIATKFGFNIVDGKPIGVNSRPENVKKVCDESLARLGLDYIDLFYQHRVDTNVPIEDTVGAMAELVAAGKIRYLGLSEAGAANIRRAHAVHPITALQSEYSLWERNIETEILPTLRELGIGLVPYSPLGRGFLTGAIKSVDDLVENDWRRANNPRFSAENLDRNQAIVDAIKEIAAKKNATPGQLALAWVLAQGEDVVPIPGTKRRTYLRENVAANDIDLTAEDLAWLDEKIPAAAGERYTPGGMRLLDR